jgi:hypothetical protein
VMRCRAGCRGCARGRAVFGTGTEFATPSRPEPPSRLCGAEPPGGPLGVQSLVSSFYAR